MPQRPGMGLSLQTLRDHKCQARLLPKKTLKHNNWRKKVKQYLSTDSALWKALGGKFQAKEVNCNQENTRNKKSQTRKLKGGTNATKTKL